MNYGYFDDQNDEYVITREDLPVSWTNYLGVEDMCAVVNHLAGGYLFYQSPEYHRITRFRPNGVPMDRPGFYVYLRDQESGDYWSLTWQPAPAKDTTAQYRTRFGLSYSVYECNAFGIRAKETLSIPIGEKALVMDVELVNESQVPRRISAFTYVEFSFHQIPIDNQNFQMSLYCAGSSYHDGTILYDLFYEENGYQYFTCSRMPDAYDCLRDAFIGPYRTESNPAAVESGQLGGSAEKGGNHCAGLQNDLVLQPGESARLLYFLGEGREEEARAIRGKYQAPRAIDLAYDALRTYWKNKKDTFHVTSGEKGLDTMINTWTLYQAQINITFSRFASFIEVGGRTGLGYRDTAQDAMTLVGADPKGCRRRMVELLRALTRYGYGIHLFEPRWFAPKDPNAVKKKPFKSPTVIPDAGPSSHVHGLEDACSDDALWLIPSITEYVRETGDFGFVDEMIGYADGGKGSVYEHMERILEFSAREVGPHGICKGLRADWNDCLNLGGGESALVTFLHYAALSQFISLAQYLGRAKDVARYTAMRETARESADAVLWDGDWFLRGFTASGKPIGTHEDEEGRIHLESNAWAVLSGEANPEKGRRALDEIHDQLATPYGIMLNAPAYTRPDDEVGFITRVYPGLKENASIFSHPNPWVWAAECVLGNGSRAWEYYRSLCPYYQNDQIETRYAEPYSYCQFISGKDHTTYGRAHHPFMTGSGGWAYYSVTHYLLGIRPDYDGLIIDPCIAKDCEGYRVQRMFRGAEYDIEVRNPNHREKGVRSLLMDGNEVTAIPVMPAGSRHTVTVVM